MKTADQAHIETQKHQRRIPEGAQLAVEYKIESRIETAIKEGKYDIVITIDSKDCQPVAEFLRSLGYFVSWVGARAQENRHMTIGWHPNDRFVDDWDGP